MPNMHFPIDIIWISDEKKILGIHENVPPETDMANPKFYTPPAPARYVLEVNAGFSRTHGFRAGDSVAFTLIE